MSKGSGSFRNLRNIIARPNWTAIGVVVSLLMSAPALWLQYQQMPQRLASIRLEVARVQFLNRSPGQWLAAPTVVLSNEGTSRAEDLRLDFQHWPLSWTGVVPAQETFAVDRGEKKMFFMSADTVAEPDTVLSSGKHLYFAVRARWIDSSTGRQGCRVFYLDIRLAPGPEVGSRLPLFDVLGDRPAKLSAPDIGSCPAL